MLERPIICHRLFFALLPPLILSRRMVEAAGVVRCRPMLAERVHMTMFILDDLPRVELALVTLLRAMGDAVTASPIAITLDRLSASDRSVALRPARANAALVALHRDLATLARAAGIASRDGYRFNPHLTLGYDSQAPRSERVAPVSWNADELVLIHSRVGQTHHDVIDRWKLRRELAQPSLF